MQSIPKDLTSRGLGAGPALVLLFLYPLLFIKAPPLIPNCYPFLPSQIQEFEATEQNDWIPVQKGDFLALLFETPVIGYAQNSKESFSALVTPLPAAKLKRLLFTDMITFTQEVKRMYRCVTLNFKGEA